MHRVEKLEFVSFDWVKQNGNAFLKNGESISFKLRKLCFTRIWKIRPITKEKPAYWQSV